MIKVVTGRFNNLEYDVRGIAMSFYPGEEIFFEGEFGCEENDSFSENDGSGIPEGCGEVVHELDLEKIFGCGNARGESGDAHSESDDAGDIPKNELRKKLYRYLEKETGRTLPWGILIGIRPTKLTRQYLEMCKVCQLGRNRLTHFSKMCQSVTSQLTHPSQLTHQLTHSEEEIAQAAKWMQDEYLVSEEKAILASEIAARELKVLGSAAKTTGARPYNLYIGIPFCPSRCSYCSFASQPAALWEGRMGEYTDALIKELEAMREMTRGGGRIASAPNSIYIGGGTPTTLPDEDFERLLKKVNELFASADEQPASIDARTQLASTDASAPEATSPIEFTVEAGRPDTITEAKLAIMKKYKVNRISINPQSMNPATLKRIGRNHTVSDITKAFQAARDVGFDNINMDIILGLPGETAEDVEKTLIEIQKLKPDSLTVHALAVKRAARLNLEAEGAVMPGGGEEESRRMMEAAHEAAAEMNLKPYYMYRQKNMAGNLENVGYAAPGRECYYNIAMMEETESIIACGAGTVSKCVLDPTDPAHAEETGSQNITRCDTHKDPKLYIEQIDEMIERKRRLFA